MHDGMPYGRNQGQGQGHSREVDRQSPTGLIFIIGIRHISHFHHDVICFSVKTQITKTIIATILPTVYLQLTG